MWKEDFQQQQAKARVAEDEVERALAAKEVETSCQNIHYPIRSGSLAGIRVCAGE